MRFYEVGGTIQARLGRPRLFRVRLPEDDGDQVLGEGGRRITATVEETDDNLPELRNQKRHRGRVRCLQAKTKPCMHITFTGRLSNAREMDYFHNRCELILNSNAVRAV